MRVEFEELELPFDDLADDAGSVDEGSLRPSAGTTAPPSCTVGRDPLGTFPCCPLCGGELRPEHAHFRCSCGWRDSCCD